MSITDYMTAIKACTDDLAQLEHPMDVDDITAKILNGLNYAKFGSVIEAVRARDTSISFEALHEKLIQQELRLKHTPAPTPSPFPPSAHAANFRPNTNNTNQSRPSYQYRRQNYQSNRSSNYSPKSSNSTPSQPGYSKPYKGRCHYCDHVGHVASDCRDFQAKYPNVVFPTRQPRGPPHAHTATHQTNQPSHSWTVDSGASHHITDDLNTLSLHQAYDGPDDLVIGDGSAISILILANPTGAVLLQGPLIDGSYVWSPTPPQAHIAVAPGQALWHHRLGHPSNKVLQVLNSKFNFRLSYSNPCIACQLNKSHKLAFGHSTLNSTAPLDLIFSDLGTSPVTSHESFKYYVIFVDHFTHYIWIYPLKRKSDIASTFHKFRAIVENFFNKPIKQFYSDNGGEFIKFTSDLNLTGITHLTSPPHTPEHNGFAERRHRHIVETGLSLLTHAQLPSSEQNPTSMKRGRKNNTTTKMEYINHNLISQSIYANYNL